MRNFLLAWMCVWLCWHATKKLVGYLDTFLLKVSAVFLCSSSEHMCSSFPFFFFLYGCFSLIRMSLYFKKSLTWIWNEKRRRSRDGGIFFFPFSLLFCSTDSRIFYRIKDLLRKNFNRFLVEKSAEFWNGCCENFFYDFAYGI